MTTSNTTFVTEAGLTPGQLGRLEEDGFLLLPGLLAAGIDLRTAYAQFKRDLDARAGSLVRNDRFVSGLIPPPIGTLYENPVLVRLGRQLLGDNLAVYMNRLLLKDREWSGAVAVHQDMPYFHGSQAKLSIFVALTPQDPGNGALRFYAGSHKYGNIGRGDILVDQWPPMREFAPRMEVGDVLLMSFFTWHYSQAAVVPHERALLQIVYQPSSDGSYTAGTLCAPTLVSGAWQTTVFVPLDFGLRKT
jgi:hypothetical protein